MYFNDGRSHIYEYGLPVNFTRTSSFCAGHVFIQPVRSKLPANNNNIMYNSYGICTFDVRTDVIVKLFIVKRCVVGEIINDVMKYCCLFVKHFLDSI